MASESSALQELSGRDWANLVAGPTVLIAERLLSNSIADYFRFRAVCRAWHTCSRSLRPRGALDRRFHPRQWIMLPNTFNVQFRRCFLNIHSGKRILLEIPDIHRCYILGTTTEGLLLVCRTDTYIFQLLNPLTGQIAGLPHAATLLGTKESVDSKVRDLDLRSAGLVDDFSVVLHFEDFSLAIAKPGDNRWRHLTFQDKIISALPFAGRIYCATAKNVSVVKTMAKQPPQQLVVVANHNLNTMKSWLYLVDKDGELVLCQYGSDNDGVLPLPDYDSDNDGGLDFSCYAFRKFMGYRVDLDTSIMVPLARLDGQALFVGTSCSLLVAAGVSPYIKAETVYLCGERPKIFTTGLLGGSVELCHFDRKDAAYCLSCFVCRP